VNDDQAGESLQCPRCLLLVDVPRLDDMDFLDADGNPLLIDDVAPAKQHIADNRKMPSIMRRSGDMRMDVDEFLNIGIDDKTLSEMKGEVRPGVSRTPRYDPITGELLVPLELTEEQRVQDLGVAKPVNDPADSAGTLHYARSRVVISDPNQSLLVPFYRLLRLENLIVLSIVAAALIFSISISFIPVGGQLALFILVPFVLLITLGHFGNVIDEIGPNDKDELPAPMRGASFSEDVWRPAFQLIVAWVLVMLPVFVAAVTLRKSDMLVRELVGLSLELVGWFIFPAAALTAVCSGTFNNMLPHRMLGTIPRIGIMRYLLIAITLFAGMNVLTLGLRFNADAMNWVFVKLLSPGNQFTPPIPAMGLPAWAAALIVLPIVFGGLYLIHAALWQIALCYRRYHSTFPWVLQIFDRSDRTDTLARLRDRRFPKGPRKA
jgi:hypothetical protein